MYAARRFTHRIGLIPNRPLYMSSPLYRVLTFSLLMFTWMIFSGIFDIMHLGLGILSSVVVTELSWKLLWQRTDLSLGERCRQSLGIVKYIGWLMRQIVLSNIHILKLAFGPKELVEPVIIHHRTALRSTFARYMLAQSITLTPGTVTVKIDGDDFIVHAINPEAAKGLVEEDGLDFEMERRIAKILEPGLLNGREGKKA